MGERQRLAGCVTHLAGHLFNLSIPMKRWADAGCDLRALREGLAEEGGNFGDAALGIGDENGVVELEQLDSVAFSEHLANLTAVMLLGFDEVFFLRARLAAFAGKHGPLRIDHLFDGANHVNDFVAMLAGQ